MKKSEMLTNILGMVLATIPGGSLAQTGVTALIKRNDDPNDDLDEVSTAVAKIAVGSMLAAENLTEKDIVNDAIFVQVTENIKGDIKLLMQVMVRKPAPAAPPT